MSNNFLAFFQSTLPFFRALLLHLYGNTAAQKRNYALGQADSHTETSGHGWFFIISLNIQPISIVQGLGEIYLN